MNRFRGKTIVITGGGRGIGKAAALAFAKEGARLAICGRDPRRLGEAAAELRAAGADVLAQVCDVSDEASVADFVAAVVREFGGVDVLINNASVLGPMGTLAFATAAAWRETLAVNLTGTFLMTSAVLRAAMAAPARGVVISLSSGQGRRATAGWGPYAASKFGVEALTQVWTDETRDARIRFYTFSPGPTATAMRAAAVPDEDPNTVKKPEVVGAALVEVAVDGCPWPSGSVLRLEPSGKILC